MPSLIALEIAYQLIPALRRPVELIARRDPSLADQVRDAANSVALNVAEGARRVGRDRVNRFRIASGSADEVRAQLRVAVGWGYLTDEVVTEPMALVDRELRLLWGLMHKRA